MASRAAVLRAPILRDWLILLFCALILRAAAFGDPFLHPDEAFYAFAGQAMHHGAVPYIDFWDRKPFGLFALYWGISGLSDSVLAYQLVATLCAAGTALVIAQIARRWVSGWASLMAGVAYLAMLHPLLGMGGQSPVFYNLLIAGAALALLGGGTSEACGKFRRRYFMAMALCGLALTIKQTTLFEGVWFGLAGLWRLRLFGQSWRHCSRDAALALIIAAFPTLAIAGWYAAHGWWDIWWTAMVSSSARRSGVGLAATSHNLYAILRLLLVYVGVVVAGLATQRHAPAFRADRGLVLGWLAAAVGGFLAVPNFFIHYALPLLGPLAPLAALAYARPRLGPALLVITVTIAVILGRPFDRADRLASRANFDQMAAAIEHYRADRPLLVLHGSALLYPATHSQPPSVLVFPEHLINRFETDVSHIKTRAEVRRIIAQRPSVISIPAYFDPPETNTGLNDLLVYLRANCRPVWRGLTYEPPATQIPVLIYACR